jgi:hypothetical protein
MDPLSDVAILAAKEDHSASWNVPLVAALEKENLRVSYLDATNLSWTLDSVPPFKCLINRARDSTTGSNSKTIASYLRFVESKGIRVFNGCHPFTIANSKANQLLALDTLGFPFPRSYTVSSIEQVITVSATLQFPLLLKPDEGGMGAGIQKFATSEDLTSYCQAPENVSKHGSSLWVLQEYYRPENDQINRVWFLGTSIHCAIQAPVPFEEKPKTSECFNSCVCTLQRRPKPPSAASIPDHIHKQILSIINHCNADFGSIEYLVNSTGAHYFFDINMLSTLPNPSMINDPAKLWEPDFDPWLDLARYIRVKLT